MDDGRIQPAYQLFGHFWIPRPNHRRALLLELGWMLPMPLATLLLFALLLLKLDDLFLFPLQHLLPSPEKKNGMEHGIIILQEWNSG